MAPLGDISPNERLGITVTGEDLREKPHMPGSQNLNVNVLMKAVKLMSVPCLQLYRYGSLSILQPFCLKVCFAYYRRVGVNLNGYRLLISKKQMHKSVRNVTKGTKFYMSINVAGN